MLHQVWLYSLCWLPASIMHLWRPPPYLAFAAVMATCRIRSASSAARSCQLTQAAVAAFVVMVHGMLARVWFCTDCPARPVFMCMWLTTQCMLFVLTADSVCVLQQVMHARVVYAGACRKAGSLLSLDCCCCAHGGWCLHTTELCVGTHPLRNLTPSLVGVVKGSGMAVQCRVVRPGWTEPFLRAH